MIGVALVSLTLFASITALRLSPRARRYQSQASGWRIAEDEQRKHLARCRKEIAGLAQASRRLRTRRNDYHALQAADLAAQIADQTAWWEANAAHTEEMITYCSMMRGKYEKAASYPWLGLAADRPPPYWSGVTDSPPADVAE